MTTSAWIALAGLAFALLSAAAGAIIWLVRLEGENKMTRALFDQHKEFVESRHGGIEALIATGFTDVKKAISELWTQVHSKADKAK